MNHQMPEEGRTMTDTHFEILTATTLLDLEGTRQFAEAIGRAQERAALTGASQWAALWSPATHYTALGVVTAGGLERTCFLGPQTKQEADEYIAATVEASPDEFNL